MAGRQGLGKAAALLATVGLALCVAAARADEPTTAPSTQPTSRPDPRVQALIDDLTSDSYDARAAATTKLGEMGEAVEPQLRAALTGDLSDEARARVTAALREIQERREWAPSVITLHYKNAPLETVLDDFSRQAGADLGTRSPDVTGFTRNRKVSIDLDHASFWAALETLGQLGNIRPALRMDDEHMTLGPGGWEVSTEHAVINGPFIIMPQSCNASVSYGRGGGNPSLWLQIQVMAEPKIRVVGIMDENWLTECVDEKGHSLVGQQRQNSFSQRHWFWQLSANLLTPQGIGEKIARLKGELKFTIQTKSQTVVVDNLMQVQNLANTIGRTTLTIGQCVAEGSHFTMHLMVDGLSSGSNPWQQLQQVLGDLQVLDAQGHRLRQQQSMYNMSAHSRFEATVQYVPTDEQGQPTGAPDKLKWEAASETQNRTISFELDNLDLPIFH
jgi:hypothetical protein